MNEPAEPVQGWDSTDDEVLKNGGRWRRLLRRRSSEHLGTVLGERLKTAL